MVGLLGMLVLIGVAALMSENRRAIPWRLVAVGTLIQFLFALAVLRTEPGRLLFAWFNDAIHHLLAFTDAGSRFVFGEKLLDPAQFGDFVFAVKVLPTIIFFSALMGVLYHLGVMQLIVAGLARVMMRLLNTSGAETLACSANIFVGQTEAPLLIKPYVEKMTRSELMTVMTAGFATVAGGVMAAYVAMLSDRFPDIAGHLMAASLMSAPAALVMAKIIIPETEEPATRGQLQVDVPKTDANVIEAAASGAGTGLTLALNVGAMLLAFIALVAMADAGVKLLTGLAGYPGVGLGQILEVLFFPFAMLMGVPHAEAGMVAQLLGQKIVLNEFVSYAGLAEILKTDPTALSGRTVAITTYALCGFANFSSIGIQIAGIGGLAPSRRSDLARLGLAAMVAGNLACFQTACIAGLLL